MSILLKCLLFAILTKFAECGSCLDPKLYRPCQCSTLQGVAEINCMSGPTIEDAAKIFKVLSGKVKEPLNFVILDYESKSIGEKIFGDVPVKMAYFNMPKLKYLSNSSIIGQEDRMESLHFASSNLEKIPYQGQLKKLKTFQFYENRAIIIIRKNWFSEIQNGNVLENLHIHSTAIQSIEKYAFSELVALRTLNLQDNQLSALDSNIISKNLPLAYVDLRFNKLMKFPEDFLKLLPHGAETRLTENLITHISAETFELISQKEFKIKIYGNPLQCDCKWLPFINGSLTKEWKSLIIGECKALDSTNMVDICYLKPKDFSSCH